MTQPMSTDAMLSALRDIRLPPEANGETVTDLLAALGLAGLALLLLAGGVRLVTTARLTLKPPTLHQEVAALDSTPEPDRRIALLHLLKARRQARFMAVKDRLYQPGAPLSSDEIVAEILRD